jgi:FkbM family methyltransferase
MPVFSLPNLPPGFLFRCFKLARTLERELVKLDIITAGGRTAIDIGANIGLWSYALCNRFETVEAFEPQPRCYNHLSGCNLPRVNLHNVALSSRTGSAELKIPAHHGLRIPGMASLNDVDGECERFEVTLRQLDEFDFRNVDFIKIDVEGHETEVLAGARDTILREKPVMVIEIEQRHISLPLTDVVHSVMALGYEAYFLKGSRLQSFAEFDYGSLQRRFTEGKTSMFDTLPKQYINNFIFKPG